MLTRLARTLRVVPRATLAPRIPATIARFVATDAEARESLGYDERRASVDPLWYPLVSKNATSGVPRVRLPQFVTEWHGHDFVEAPVSDPVRVEGRITLIRKAGRLMYFIDVIQDGAKVQVVASNKLIGCLPAEFDASHGHLKRGDCVGAVGLPGKTKTGELSVKLKQPVQMLAPSLRCPPNKMVDRGLINRNRALNYLVNPELKHPIVVKSQLCRLTRDFFNQRGFLEVQTPMLAGLATGANARGFDTKDVHGNPLLLRVAPELWLKKLVIGGFDKVFEIGTNFRNEGVDATHNPEFTLCEFYQLYASLSDLVELTKSLFAHWQHSLAGPLVDRFITIEFIPELQKRTGKPLPELLSQPELVQYCADVGLTVKATDSPAQLLDLLCGEFLELVSSDPANANVPVFITHQPELMSPLAKLAVVDYDGRQFPVLLRFEVFVNGKEYVNAYEEENDPVAQEAKFRHQVTMKDDFNDDELLVPDWRYIQQMEYGLPPTGGWGCGIDRLAMLFLGADRIEQVNTFGTVDDVRHQ